MSRRARSPQWTAAGFLLAALTSAAAAAQGTEPAPPVAPAPDQGTPAGPPRDLLSIARIEAEREREMLQAKVRSLLADLGSSNDAALASIQRAIDELVAIGPAAIDPLLAAIDHEEFTPAKVNAGMNAARALGRIQGDAVLAGLTKVGRTGGKYGRRNAARALAIRGDLAALPVLREMLAHEDPSIIREALLAIGAVGGPEAAALLAGFVQADDEGVASAAIQGAGRLQDPASAAAVQERLKHELDAEMHSEPVVLAALGYFANLPSAAATPEIERVLREPDSGAGLRLAAVDALAAAATQLPQQVPRILEALRAATRSSPRGVVQAAALAMLELGDESGVQAATAELDIEVERNPRNYNTRYRRADLLLEFRQWRDAVRDYQDGLRVEKDPHDPDRIHLGLARGFAGMGRFADATRYLRRLPESQVAGLPAQYPEFQEMAADSRWGTIFSGG